MAKPTKRQLKMLPKRNEAELRFIELKKRLKVFFKTKDRKVTDLFATDLIVPVNGKVHPEIEIKFCNANEALSDQVTMYVDVQLNEIFMFLQGDSGIKDVTMF